MSGRFKDHDQNLNRIDINFSMEKARRESTFELLNAAYKPVVEITDEVVKDYFQSIIASRLPSKLLIRSTKQFDSRQCGHQGAIFTYSWSFQRGTGSEIELMPTINVPSDELRDPTMFGLSDRVQFRLALSSPWDQSQRTYLEQLEPFISIEFWSLYSTSFDKNIACCQQINNAPIPGIQLFTSQPYDSMAHRVEFPIDGLVPSEVENSLTHIAPLITPFILERNPH